MYKNYLKLALRNLTRYRLYSQLNIIGLEFGVACFFLITLFSIDKMTFGRFHNKADDIYRVVQQQQSPNKGEQNFEAVLSNITEGFNNRRTQ